MKSCCLFIVLFFSGSALKAEIVFNAADTSHPFNGFGAQIWSGDMRVESLFSNLNLKYFRMCPGGCLNPPADATRAQMDAYVNSEYNGTARGNNIIATLQWAQAEDIMVILNRFGGLSAWLGTNNLLLSQYFDDFARMIAAEILFFKSRGLPVDYIELFNEPEGNWNVKCPGADYNVVVQLVRTELNERGLGDVGIIGPGLAILENGPSWINALDSNGKNALAAWSTHAWDEQWGHTTALPSFLDQQWKNYFGSAVNNADPCRIKPIIVTEYATGVKTFNGVTFGDATVTDSNQFAERCYENSLTLANNGANVLCFWEAANQYWQEDPPFWGLMRKPSEGSTLRPVYYALSTLSTYIPDNARVLNKTWNDSVISAAGFIGGEQLVMAFANSSATTQSRTIQITGVTSFNITAAKAFIAGAVVNKISEVNYVSGQLTISLPRESTLTVVAAVNECNALTGDLNGDCRVTFADFGEVASDWMKDNRTSPQMQAIDNFESYADSAALNAKWVVHTSGVPLTETLESEGDNQFMKLYTTGGGVGWGQTKYTLPGAQMGVHGVNWTYQGFTDFTFRYKITEKASDKTQVGFYNCWGEYIGGADVGNGNAHDWETVTLNLAAVQKAGMNYENVAIIGFTIKNTYYGAGDLLIDDVGFPLDEQGSGCSETIEGDVNQDCVVNFKDINDLSQNWLECTLVEQAECW